MKNLNIKFLKYSFSEKIFKKIEMKIWYMKKRLNLLINNNKKEKAHITIKKKHEFDFIVFDMSASFVPFSLFAET